jgi:phosphotransferase system enzyme I (PtsP)
VPNAISYPARIPISQDVREPHDMDHAINTTGGATSHESSLLLTLEEISQLISHSHNPHETLENIVHLIQRRFATDVSSVYLHEVESGELVLAATVGLDRSSVGRVRMRSHEGLTGLVVERMGPIMEPDAPTHPRFKYFPEAGEDSYHSFLGVPLIESGMVHGVLVVQTTDRRSFSPNEIRMLVTVGSQLAPLVSGARLLERVATANTTNSRVPAPEATPATPRRLGGCPLSPGTGLGRAYLIGQGVVSKDVLEPTSSDPAVERQRLRRATEATREEISRLSRRISLLVGEDHGAILQAQLMILQDSTVERDLAACLEARDSAESALVRTLDKYIAAFQRLTNPFFQERIFDIKDVFRRVLWHLRPQESVEILGEERLVMVAHEASVLDLFSVDLDHLVGVVVEHGGPQSHAVIIARSLGIPMVGQVPGLIDQIQNGELLRIDGTAGQVELAPSLEGVAIDEPLLGLVAEPHGKRNGIAAAGDLPGMPRVEANVNLLSEAALVLSSGASGVGLYRSEMLFLARRTLPTEEEQVEIYRKLIDALKGRPATIRTFDLRPDKLAHGASVASSLAQTLDWRLVMESPILQRLFKEQVRAILRAAADGPVRLLIPLVTRSRLLEFATTTVSQAREELEREELPLGREVPFGIMIEVAAVAPLVDAWSERVDFFSLGTNDLIASALGVDRDDPVGTLNDDILHPGLIRMIGDMITSAHNAGRPVSVCGEMASDPEGALVLAALGADSLSLAVDRVGSIRQLMNQLAPESLPALGAKLRAARTVDQVRSLLSVPLCCSRNRSRDRGSLAGTQASPT